MQKRPIPAYKYLPQYKCKLRPCLFPIIIGLSVEISDNSTKHLAYFHFCGTPRSKLQEARKNLRFSRPRFDYKLSENKQSLNAPCMCPKI